MTDPVHPNPQATSQGGTAQGQSALQIAPEVQAKFGDVIAMIQVSESMNAEERQYWVNILPIMTPEQMQNLKDILENEKKQLAAIDTKYQSQINQVGQAEVVRQTEEERKKKRLERQSAEQAHKQQEDTAAEDLLKQMDLIDATNPKPNTNAQQKAT